jgi:hypothetical protein
MSDYRELLPEETAALQAFANAHGVKWRAVLNETYWYNARPWRGTDGRDDRTGQVLHRIRNDLGVTWLMCCEIQPEQRFKAGDAVMVPFTARGEQFALVLRYNRNGRLIVRPWTASTRRWASDRTMHDTELPRVRFAHPQERPADATALLI